MKLIWRSSESLCAKCKHTLTHFHIICRTEAMHPARPNDLFDRFSSQHLHKSYFIYLFKFTSHWDTLKSSQLVATTAQDFTCVTQHGMRENVYVFVIRKLNLTIVISAQMISVHNMKSVRERASAKVAWCMYLLYHLVIFLLPPSGFPPFFVTCRQFYVFAHFFFLIIIFLISTRIILQLVPASMHLWPAIISDDDEEL